MMNTAGNDTYARHRVQPAEAGDTGHDDVEPMIERACRRQPKFWVVVLKSHFGLYRITLTNREHLIGSVVRALYTYQEKRMWDLVDRLIVHSDPAGYCASFIKPWNCESKEGAISLDSEPGIRIARVPNQPPLDYSDLVS